MAIQSSTFSLPPQLSYIRDLRAKFDALQLQLGTGRKAQTYSGLGSRSSLDLILKQQRSQIAVYNQSIDVADLRLKTLDQVSTRLENLRIDAKAAIDPNNYREYPNGRTESQISSEILLRDFLSQLNGNVGGRYLFSGTALDRAPVAELDYILNGDANYAGLRQVTREYNEADLGADGRGRLGIGLTADPDPDVDSATVRLFEDAIGGAHPFGFKLYSAQSGFSNVTVDTGRKAVPTTIPTGAVDPANLGLTFTGGDLVVDGKTITIADGNAASINDTGAPASGQGSGVETAAKVQALDGQSITLTAADGTERTFDFTGTSTPADLVAALEADGSGFSVDASSADGLRISRADGQSFTITTSDPAVDAAIGFASGAAIDNGEVENNVTLQSLADEITAKLNDPTDIGITASVGANGGLVFSKADGTDLTIGGDLPLLNKLAIPVGGNGQAVSTNGVEAADGTKSFDFRFDGQPEPGEVVRLFLDLPDGTQTEIRIGAEGPTQDAPQYTFQIGDTVEETAANFQNVLDQAIQKVARTELRAASSVRASQNFFDNLPRAGGEASGPFRAVQGTTATAGSFTFQFANGGTAFAAVDEITFGISIDGAAASPITINQADVIAAGGDATIDDINEFTTILATKLGNGVTVTNDGTKITITSNTTGANSRVAITGLNTNADNDGSGTVTNQSFGLSDGPGTPGQVTATGFANATGFASSPSDTVAWYRGENGDDPARGTNRSRIDDNLSVSYGARANEDAYREIIQSLAAFVSADLSSAQPDNQEFYQALADRTKQGVTEPEDGLSKIRENHIEFAAVYRAVDDARNRHLITNATVDIAIDDIEGINKEEVAVKLLELQTLLEISYRATSIAFDLTLADFI